MEKKRIGVFLFCLLAATFLIFPFNVHASLPEKDILIKGSGSAVYYYASDGKRYVFPNQKTYDSWFTNFNGVVTVSDEELGEIPIGGNVTYRPGFRMVKITTDPKVYAVDRGGMLRWITSEDAARTLYGDSWNSRIDDVPDPFFVNYTVGSQIDVALDFDPGNRLSTTDTINADKNLPLGANPRRADTMFTGGTLTPVPPPSAVPTTTPPVITSIKGTLAVSLDLGNPDEQTLRSGTKGVPVLKVRLSAGVEEDIKITKVGFVITPLDGVIFSDCSPFDNSGWVVDGSGTATSSAHVLSEPVVILKGSYKTFILGGDVHYGTSECPHTIKGGLSAGDTTAAWGALYAGKYNIKAMGVTSGEQLFVTAPASAGVAMHLYGNNVNIRLLQSQFAG